MRLNEITDKDWTWKDYIHSPGDVLYARNPQTQKIVRVVIRHNGGASSFMGFMYQVEFEGDPIGHGNGGIWGANNEDLYKTQEEGERAMFKDKLKGRE